MAYYISLASKLERAVRAFLILQGKSADAVSFSENGDTFVANDSRTRKVFPNKTCLASSVNPTRGYRPEGTLNLQVQHKFAAALQPEDSNLEAQRLLADNYLGATMDTLGIGNTDNQAMAELAAAITAAGQWLATPDPAGIAGDPADKIVQNNLDMINFRVDWIKRATPFLTRGNADNDGTVWAEILNFEVFVSYASIPN